MATPDLRHFDPIERLLGITRDGKPRTNCVASLKTPTKESDMQTNKQEKYQNSSFRSWREHTGDQCKQNTCSRECPEYHDKEVMKPEVACLDSDSDSYVSGEERARDDLSEGIPSSVESVCSASEDELHRSSSTHSRLSESDESQSESEDSKENSCDENSLKRGSSDANSSSGADSTTTAMDGEHGKRNRKRYRQRRERRRASSHTPSNSSVTESSSDLTDSEEDELIFDTSPVRIALKPQQGDASTEIKVRLNSPAWKGVRLHRDESGKIITTQEARANGVKASHYVDSKPKMTWSEVVRTSPSPTGRNSRRNESSMYERARRMGPRRSFENANQKQDFVNTFSELSVSPPARQDIHPSYYFNGKATYADICQRRVPPLHEQLNQPSQGTLSGKPPAIAHPNVTDQNVPLTASNTIHALTTIAANLDMMSEIQESNNNTRNQNSQQTAAKHPNPPPATIVTNSNVSYALPSNSGTHCVMQVPSQCGDNTIVTSASTQSIPPQEAPANPLETLVEVSSSYPVHIEHPFSFDNVPDTCWSTPAYEPPPQSCIQPVSFMPAPMIIPSNLPMAPQIGFNLQSAAVAYQRAVAQALNGYFVR